MEKEQPNSIDGNFGHHFPECALELLDLITTAPQEREHAIRSAHVCCAHDHKIGVTAANVAFDLWYPIAIARVEKASAETNEHEASQYEATRALLTHIAPDAELYVYNAVQN